MSGDAEVIVATNELNVGIPLNVSGRERPLCEQCECFVIELRVIYKAIPTVMACDFLTRQTGKHFTCTRRVFGKHQLDGAKAQRFSVETQQEYPSQPA